MNESSKTVDFQATLDAWRERGADRFDPVRFRMIDTMQRRAAPFGGETRRVLDERIAVLMNTYARDLAANIETDKPDAVRPHGPLAALLAHAANARAPNAYPEMTALAWFRETWSMLSTERQFRQSLAQVPGNAGPLNSSSLVHRSLSLMRELSPGYLQKFLSYAGALSWLEQVDGGAPSTADKETPRRAVPRQSAAGKSGRKKTR